MTSFVGSVVLIVVGLAFLAREHHELGLFCVGFGAVFLFLRIRRYQRDQASTRQLGSAIDHAAEATERMRRDESPEQIAAAFESQYGIEPIRTLEFLVGDRLRVIGRGDDRALTAAVITWTSSGRSPDLPTPAQAIASLDRRQSYYCSSGGVSRYSETSPKVPGDLIACRTHLLFLAAKPGSPLARGVAAEFVIRFLPPVAGVAKLLGELAETIHEGVREGITPEQIAEFTERLEIPGSFAVGWRDVINVRKEAHDGKGLARVELVITSGDSSALTDWRLVSGFGVDESWVDDWIDAIRTAAALEGVFLPV